MSTSTTTVIRPATDLGGARRRNEAVWKQSSAALYAGQVEESLAYWDDDARYEVAYPIEGMPAVVEGHAALVQLFAGFCGAAGARIEGCATSASTRRTMPMSPSSRSGCSPSLVDGGRYENRLVLRVTFRDGLIAEVFEYYGERRHEELLHRLGFAG